MHRPLNIWTRNIQSMKVPRYLCTGLKETIRVKQVTLSVLNVVLVSWSHIVLVLVVDVYTVWVWPDSVWPDWAWSD